MSFDATARNGVAPLTEKRERPRLPMVSFFTGCERANMNFYSFHIGDPWQSQLEAELVKRDESTSAQEKSRINGRIRSIRLKAARAKGSHTEKMWEKLVASFDCRCVFCGVHMAAVEVQKDHILPIYQGGSDSIENLQPLCKKCNTAKGPDSTNWAAFRMERGF